MVPSAVHQCASCRLPLTFFLRVHSTVKLWASGGAVNLSAVNLLNAWRSLPHFWGLVRSRLIYYQWSLPGLLCSHFNFLGGSWSRRESNRKGFPRLCCTAHIRENLNDRVLCRFWRNRQEFALKELGITGDGIGGHEKGSSRKYH